MNIYTAVSDGPNNPYIILTFIAAPALLTNASALMVMSTSNRFARAIDRGRELSRQIEEAQRDENMQVLDRLKEELMITERRAILILSSMRAFYFSLGAFAFAAFISLLGAGLIDFDFKRFYLLFAFITGSSVFLAVGGLAIGSILLFFETKITVGILQDRITRIRKYHLFEIEP